VPVLTGAARAVVRCRKRKSAALARTAAPRNGGAASSAARNPQLPAAADDPRGADRRGIDASLDCSNTSGLWPAQVKTRVDNE
jgi:hypothetical protein